MLSYHCRRKQNSIQKKLDDLGVENLEERLQTAASVGPGGNPFRFSQRIADVVEREGRPALVLEIVKMSETGETCELLAERAAKLVEYGADAVSVRVDEEHTDSGLQDIFAVCRKVSKDIPVFCRDWFLHPLQVVEAKTAGCTGVIGILASVTGNKGTPVLSSFGAALGLDCPVEVVNLAEMRSMEAMGVPFYAMDISVGLSVGIKGFGQAVVDGVLKELPFGALSMIGVSSIENARSARISGADALYIREGLMEEYVGREKDLIVDLIMATNGDD